MRSLRQTVGECPKCGDELYVMKTHSRKRFAKCVNEDCSYSFGLPSRGSFEETGVICPVHGVEIIAIIPNLKLKHGNYRKQEKQTFFWASRPCFACNQRSKCAFWDELKEVYQ